MIVIFFFGVFAGFVAPLSRRVNARVSLLAGGAAMLIIFAVAGLLHADARQGLATVEANRKEYLFVLACELPVLLFAVISSIRAKWLFWLGWGLHLAFCACVAVVAIWLQYFWHW